MPARDRMTMRAVVHRQAVATTDFTAGTDPFGVPIDPYGVPTTEAQLLHSAMPCYVQPTIERTIADGEKVLAVATYLMLAPLGTDLTQEDRITEVSNGANRNLFGRPLRITALVRRETHLEGSLEEYS